MTMRSSVVNEMLRCLMCHNDPCFFAAGQRGECCRCTADVWCGLKAPQLRLKTKNDPGHCWSGVRCASRHSGDVLQGDFRRDAKREANIARHLRAVQRVEVQLVHAFLDQPLA